MDWLRALLETSPMTALFLTIAAGYLVGEVNLKGFALGSGAVLFVGLACGAFAPKSAPAGMVGTLGLLLFLYCMGVQYGREWYRGLTSAEGLKANFAAAVRRDGRGRGLAGDLRDRRGQSVPGARHVRRLGHEHLDAPGDSRRARGPGRGGRLQRDLPVWRRRPNPLLVSLRRPVQAED